MELQPIGCAICGTQIKISMTRLWDCQFYALYVREKLGREAHLSGPGNREYHYDSVRVSPTDFDQTSDAVNICLMRSNLGAAKLRNDPPIWGFPIHQACWRLMAEVAPDQTPDLSRLFALFASFPIALGNIDWGHDYGGAIPYSDSTNLAPGEETAPMHRGSSSRSLDPFDIPEIRQVFEQLEQDDVTREDSPRTARPMGGIITNNNHDEVFARLPIEILQHILTFLPTRDLPFLRRASRIYAAVPLHELFWRSRFHPGLDFDFVFEARRFLSQVKGRRWKAVYHSLQDLRRQKYLDGRARRWRLACSVMDLLSKVGGENERHIPLPAVVEARQQGWTSDESWITASRSLRPLDTNFDSGSRALCEDMISIPEELTGIFVSIINIFGGRYIAGIRIEGGQGESLVLGYRHANEVLVTDSQKQPFRIMGFCLAQGQRGIRGLSVITGPDTVSDWVGDYEGIPQRRLLLSSAGTEAVESLRSGFDALKLVSLSISNESPRRPLRDNPELRVQDTALWLPDIPPTCLTIHGASDRWAIRPILMITLGDNQGSRLKHLVKITVWIEVRDAIRGIDFFFSDSQEPLRFGVFERRPSPSRGKDLPDERLEKVDFAVNGPDGERIIAIDTCYSRASGCCQGFRITTNRGRTAEFPSEALQNPPKVGWHTKSMQCAEGSQLVGFWAVMTSFLGFIDFGAVSSQCA